MAVVVVLLELLEPADAAVIRASGEPVDASAVRQAHAAARDPDVPGDPSWRTACGLDTEPMLVERWRAARLGEGWYPPSWYGLVCLDCDEAVRTGSY